MSALVSALGRVASRATARTALTSQRNGMTVRHMGAAAMASKKADGDAAGKTVTVSGNKKRSEKKDVQQKEFSSAAAAGLSPAMTKLAKNLETEMKYERDNYSPDTEIAKAPEGWTVEDVGGEITIALVKTGVKMGPEGIEKEVRVEWQLANALDDESMEEDYDPENPDAEQEPPTQTPATDFTITVQAKDGEEGMSLYCNTYSGMADELDEEDKEAAGAQPPFAVGAVKVWTNKAERDSAVSYNGPEFEDFPVALQASLNEFLAEIGIDASTTAYIDATAVDKEQREYMRWLENMNKFISK